MGGGAPFGGSCCGACAQHWLPITLFQHLFCPLYIHVHVHVLSWPAQEARTNKNAAKRDKKKEKRDAARAAEKAAKAARQEGGHASGTEQEARTAEAEGQ